MRDTHQKVRIVINGSFTIVLLIHVFYIGKNLMFPGNPNIRVHRKDLMDIRFPLAFKLCVSRLDDSNFEPYYKYGYRGSYAFFRGESMYNASLRGWRGHTRNNSVIGLGSVKGEMSFFLAPTGDKGVAISSEHMYVCDICSKAFKRVLESFGLR